MRPQLRPLIHELEDLHAEMVHLVDENRPVITQVHPENQSSATNLLHYLALRRHDVRALQEQLTDLGLSSLGRTEPHVLSGVRAVIDVLSNLHQGEPAGMSTNELASSRNQGHWLLQRNTELLLGTPPEGRRVRIMVTMPPEAATDYIMVRNLLLSGMNCMRINCAHDGEEAWSGMIRNLRRAEQETGKSCKIEMDVAGPKLRTGPIEPGPAVVKFRPRRDAFGRIESPARVWLTPQAHPEPPASRADACIPLPARWLANLHAGDHISYTDTRGAKRSMTVTEAVGHNRWAEARSTGYIAPGVILTAASQEDPQFTWRASVGRISPRPQFLTLRPGDTLILTRSFKPGRPARFNDKGELVSPAQIGVTLPEFFDSVKAGQPIWFDDGKIGGIVSRVATDQVAIEITHARAAGDKLGAEKGINLPETDLKTASLTAEDLKALPFVARNADILGYSFVRTEDDIRLLQAHLAELNAKELGIVLKIETRQGFDNLPSLLLTALGSRNIGVMIPAGIWRSSAVFNAWQKHRKKFCGSRRPLTFPSSGRPRCSNPWPRPARLRAQKSRTPQWGSAPNASC